jgi:hypothetical protein
MKYKAYEQNPHSALEEIKKAFDEEKPYKAQSLCLAYFNYLENQRHIDKALDYASKDDVYKHVLKHMSGEVRSEPSANFYIDRFKEKIEKLEEQSKEFTEAQGVLQRFCEDNNIDLNALVDQYSKKLAKNMTPEELQKANEEVTKRQEGKIVISSKDMKLMPIGEEFYKLMEEQAKRNEEFYSNSWKTNQ